MTMIRIFGLGSDDLDDDDDDDDIVDVGMVNIQGMRNNHKSIVSLVTTLITAVLDDNMSLNRLGDINFLEVVQVRLSGLLYVLQTRNPRCPWFPIDDLQQFVETITNSGAVNS
ncbi:unnamed protein product [Trichobilharzia regenti]|nr:unnamed protein product [Trichobilharzia regenti]